MKRSTVLFAALLLLGLMASCSENSSSSEPAGTEGGITVTDAWARSPMADKAAAYFVVGNTGTEADQLTAAAAPDIDAMVSVHETVMQNGTAEMQPVDGVDIPAGGAVTFEPGGYHVMLEDMTEPLEVGSTITIVLTFEVAGEVTVEAEVRAFVEDEGGM